MSCTSQCNYDEGSVNLLTGSVKYFQYGYELNKTAGNVFLALFAIVTVIHIVLAGYWRKWMLLPTLCAGGALEAIGWGGRHWGYKTTYWDPSQGGGWTTKKASFLMQIICLVIAPTFFSAANYILLGTIVRKTNRRFSSITASSFSKMFTMTDVLCLIIQAIGGGVTGQASTPEKLKRGLHITAGGIIAQIVVTLVFVALFAEFHYRYKTGRVTNKQYDLLGWAKCCCGSRKSHMDEKNVTTPSTTTGEQPAFYEGAPAPTRMLLLECGLVVSTILIVARSVYRAIEMLDFNYGTQSGVYYDQTTFIALDASLMLALLFFWIPFHPGLFDGRKMF